MCVPAIGADPRKTWAHQTDSAGFEHDRLDYVLYDRLYPDAQVHLYDHLTWEERRLEVKNAQGPNDQARTKLAEAFTEAKFRLSEYGIMEWADRFLKAVQQYRRAQETEQRPILFICHSTGGIIVKEALSRRPNEGQSDILAVCLSVTFFATPHHGSSVLSEPEYVRTVQNHLSLKWDMSKNLRLDFLWRNTKLETLNYKFAIRAVGVKIYSYVESSDTSLKVLTTNNSGHETLTTVRRCIVDSFSGKLSTSEVPVEDEEVIQLNTTHIGTPRFQGEDILYGYYIDEITISVKRFSAEERAAYHALDDDVMTQTKVDIHQFYEFGSRAGTESLKIMSAYPCLRTFLEIGPSRCIDERLQGLDTEETFESNTSRRPRIEFRLASEPAAPTLAFNTAGTDKTSNVPSQAKSTTSLVAPTVSLPQTARTRRQSITIVEDPGSPRHLKPKPTKFVQSGEDTSNKDKTHIADINIDHQPQRKHLFSLPSQSSGRFKWIHVPFTHAGWVPHILTTISQDKEDLSLHINVLMDKIWFSQHNRSRHISPHAQFVRPGVQCLTPRNATLRRSDKLTDNIQLVVYLPYLHWDSFKSLQKRAAVIKRRLRQAHARPIAKDVALGSSVEHKLIWQHLTSNRPMHCRRTLDQYRDPSLRDTSVRDRDQILYKRTRTDVDAPSPKEDNLKPEYRFLEQQSVAAGADTGSSNGDVPIEVDAKVLMVDQMWLWVIDNQTVVTFFTPKEKEESDHLMSREGDLRSEIYQDINGDYANQCVDPYDFAALATFHAIKALLGRTTDRNLQVFRIYQEYISILTDQQTISVTHFRNNHQFEMVNDIDISNEVDALLELRDIEDELKAIDKLLDEQRICVSDMITQYKDLNSRQMGVKGINFLSEVQQFLNDHQKELGSMLEDVVTAQKTSKSLLDIQQKQANTVKADYAREKTEITAGQARSVMIFTIWTIIFLPLSFFTSVFGIHSREWTGGNYPHLYTIFTCVSLISLVVVIIALLLAFNKLTRRFAQRVWKFVAMPIMAAMQRVGLTRPHMTPQAPPMELDLEEQAAFDRERADAEELSMAARTHKRVNWEEFPMNLPSVVGV